MNKLVELLSFGQSYWLDNLSRAKIKSGELARRVATEGLRGITSNPSIFHKAITSGSDYDVQIKAEVALGKTAYQIYDALTVQDLKDACDLLRPVFEASACTDGFVSLEVSPYLARDTDTSISEAKRLHGLVNKENCLIKIPGTAEGVEAIEELLYQGININVTLLFGIPRYEEIARAYIRALQRRVKEGKPIEKIVSFASFFLSRIDVLVDSLLRSRIVPNYKATDAPQLLIGKAGLASARLAYQSFLKVFSGSEWEQLKSKGAKVQKPLWASTSNKDPFGYDLRYVETVIGVDTVNTIPDETIEDFADHGTLVKDTVLMDITAAEAVFPALKRWGIDIDFVSQQLEDEGIVKFNEAFDDLMVALEAKRAQLLSESFATQTISGASMAKKINSAYVAMDERLAGRRLFQKDAYLWEVDPDEVKMIRENMGWVELPDISDEALKNMQAFSTQIKEEGYTSVVLLGMGGSSLCSEVARESFGSAPGYPQLLVLDNTDPAAILQVQGMLDLSKTLFIAASKSGGTQETISFFKYFYRLSQEAGVQNVGQNFIAITDAGSPLVQLAEQYHFRCSFLNPPGIGGRYSVLSDFGMLPMALMGLDVRAMMDSALQMKKSCDGQVPTASNPGLSLGAALGICQKFGKDKVTFVMSSSIGAFGYWVEQLLAESTGKEGQGLIPVNGESLVGPEFYSNDRLFVQMVLAGDDVSNDDIKLKALEQAGHPVVRIIIPNLLALGAEYYRWEVAVATSGIVMAINPFNQPNVEQSKQNTRDILKAWLNAGHFEQQVAFAETAGIKVFAGKRVAAAITPSTTAVSEFLASFEALAKAGDYVAFLPYFLKTDSRHAILESWRNRLGEARKVATTLLTGPRYLHSTGQLHKGGPDSGLYIIITGTEAQSLAIPDEDFGFGILHEAQSKGDFKSLDDKGRNVILINLGSDVDAGLAQLSTFIS
ncbi:MAG: bifunctional transaldolase/phosoglucose isomerase [Bacteroidetes bacterium]|nr:bifunctional transaldolase/phosoglucose isomerase [Bacteroidota bacterium]